MESKKTMIHSSNDLEKTLVPLEFHQLEERLEVSSLVPGGHGQESSSAIVEIENCCNDKCNGDALEMDDPIDTGEIVGGRR